MVRKTGECAAIRSYNNKKSTIGKFDRWKVPPSSFCCNHAVWCDSGLSFSNVHYLFQFVYLMHAVVKIITLVLMESCFSLRIIYARFQYYENKDKYIEGCDKVFYSMATKQMGGVLVM